MESQEIRSKFLRFFEDRGHAIVSSSSLVPENDPSVLLTTAGMQQFKPYYIGKRDPNEDFDSLSATSSQKCIRTSDIEEVGDNSHLTFFEMLGNFSFGEYFKKEAIEFAHEFITKELDLKIDFVSVFGGEGVIPADLESEKTWKTIDKNLEVKRFGRADNFWGPTGVEGPCGPTTEIYVGGVEIWNIVFNEFYQSPNAQLSLLAIKGIDTGMGLERLTMVVQNKKSVFSTDFFTSLLKKDTKEERIVADHMRTAVFLVSDGVMPSNVERGYILRRLIRRAHVYAKRADLNALSVAKMVMDHPSYRNLYDFAGNVEAVIKEEIDKFEKTLDAGMKKFEKGEDPFVLFTTYGFPYELTKELARERGITIDDEEFGKKFEKHREVSKAGMEQKFKGGLAGHSEAEIRLHTATHLLHQALRDILGSEIGQKGSNITPERLRFDFSFNRKLTDEEKNKIEKAVNKKIQEALPVIKIVLPKKEAELTGAIHFFGEKYGDDVSIYYIGHDFESAYSKEYCGGPHASNTLELGEFRINKEEAVSAGVRRIKATLQ